MFVVYEAGSLIDAELLRRRLAEKGIESTLKNDNLQGALGMLPLSVRPEVYVLAEEDVAEARQCVREMEAAAEAADRAERVCGHCGESNPSNFEVCWKCRAELPATSTS